MASHLLYYRMGGRMASHRDMLIYMPGKHANPARVYRPDPELYQRAQLAAQKVGSNMNAHVVEFLKWLAGDTDELPSRPDPSTDDDDQGR